MADSLESTIWLIVENILMFYTMFKRQPSAETLKELKLSVDQWMQHSCTVGPDDPELLLMSRYALPRPRNSSQTINLCRAILIAELVNRGKLTTD